MQTYPEALSPVLPPAKCFSLAFRGHDRRPLSLERLSGAHPVGQRTALVNYRKDIEGFAREWKRLFGKRVETWEECLLPRRALTRFNVHAGGRSADMVMPVWLTPSASLNELVRVHYASRLQAFADRCAGLPLPSAPEHPGKGSATAAVELWQLAQARWLFRCLVAALKHGAPDAMLAAHFGAQPLVWCDAVPDKHVEDELRPSKLPPRVNAWSRKLVELDIQECIETLMGEPHELSYWDARYQTRQYWHTAPEPSANEPYPLHATNGV